MHENYIPEAGIPLTEKRVPIKHPLMISCQMSIPLKLNRLSSMSPSELLKILSLTIPQTLVIIFPLLISLLIKWNYSLNTSNYPQCKQSLKDDFSVFELNSVRNFVFLFNLSLSVGCK